MFAGTWTLIKLILRRDRIKLPAWIISIVAFLLYMIPLLREMYGDAASLNTMYQSFGSNPAGLFLTGPMDAPVFGGLMTIETVLWWGMAVVFMNTLLVVRHTRQNEEMGAQELILSTQVHRSAGLTAVLIVAFLANIVMALGIGFGLAAMESSWGPEGAWLYALAMGLFGFVWAVLAAGVAQFVESTRSANGILAGLMGVAFVLRGIGDFMGKTDANGVIQPAWPSWFSPFGWMQATRSLTFPEWWPLIVPAVFVVVAIPLVFGLLSRRDVGAGILPSRKGHARASAWLKTPVGLTWYLQKNVFTGWLIGVVSMVVIIGLLVPEMSHIYEGSANAKEFIEALGGAGAMIPAFLSAMLSIVVLMILAYVVQGLIKLRSEESNGHLESLLATRLSRLKWLGLHGLVIMAGGVCMLATSGVVLALSVSFSADVNAYTGDYTWAALSYVPILLLFVGLYVVLFGLMPRASGLIIWLAYGFVTFMAWLGPILRLDERVINISPMSHIAAAPAEPIVMGPLLIMSGISLAAIILGATFWRHRNLVER